MREQDKLKVSAGEDLLAFIPHIVGYWPENSLVCIGMCGKSLRATMRLDLPPEGTAELDGFAAVAAAQLSSDAEADGVLLAFFAGREWNEPEHCPHGVLYCALGEAFAEAGLPVRDAWYVGPSHWRSIECRNPSCCPWPGRSNTKITGSFVNAELVYRGSAVDGNPRDRVPGMTAVKDHRFAETVRVAAESFLAPLGQAGLAANQLGVTLGAWERALAHWPERPNASMAAYLLASLGGAPVRDAVLVSLATTPEMALAGVLGVGQLQGDVGEPVVPSTWFGGNQCAGWDIGILCESETAICAAGRVYGDVLLGGSPEAGHPACSPNWSRLDVAEELLLFLAGSITGPGKAPVLCMLGWIQWCRGRGSWAGTYFNASLEALPGYRLAQLLERLLDAGCIAAWAKDKQTAWPGYRSREEAA
ncbi:MAG: DUF4192 domain-containing protein [Specibacter sp.]